MQSEYPFPTQAQAERLFEANRQDNEFCEECVIQGIFLSQDAQSQLLDFRKEFCVRTLCPMTANLFKERILTTSNITIDCRSTTLGDEIRENVRIEAVAAWCGQKHPYPAYDPDALPPPPQGCLGRITFLHSKPTQQK